MHNENFTKKQNKNCSSNRFAHKMEMDDGVGNLFNKLTLNTEKEDENDVNDKNVNQIIGHLPTLVLELNSNNPDSILKSTIIFRKLLSLEMSPPIDQIISTGIVPRLIQLLSTYDSPQLQFEASWALTNIASGTAEQTKVVIENGAIQAFIILLNSTYDNDVRDQVIWAFGNIAGNSTEHRDMLLNQNALQPIINILQNASSFKISMVRNVTWALGNLCRGKPSPPIEIIRPALPIFVKLIQQYPDDDEIISDACWPISYISGEGSLESIQEIIDTGVCKKMIELLSHPKVTVFTPALRVIGNIVRGNNFQTQHVLDLQVLPSLLNLLKSSIRKEACWVISNITAGGLKQIQQVGQANIFPEIINLLANGEPEIKREAACTILNIAICKIPAQIKYLTEQGFIKPLVNSLIVSSARANTTTIEFSLEAVECILNIGKLEANASATQVNPYFRLIKDVDGFNIINKLKDHKNEGIKSRATIIIENYFTPIIM